jgi:seryl-tRNA synthetase
MEILAKLFGGETRVKLLRLFLFNPDNNYSLQETLDKTKSNKKEVSKEIINLLKTGIIKKKSITREVQLKKKKKIIIKKVSETGYSLDHKFPYLPALKNLLIMVSLHADDTLVKRFSSVGRIKLFIASGVFIQEWETRVDLLIVGDGLNISKLDAVMKTIESEVGREIIYSAFETEDFEYRYGMHDRLIRDIMDLPHATLVDKIGIGENKVL